MRRLGVKAALVDGHLVDGDLGVTDGNVAAVGLQPAGRAGLAVPGFVDAHINGFAGVDFLAADADGYARAGAALAQTGVVAYQPTFITSPLETYAAAHAAFNRGARAVTHVHNAQRRWGPRDPGLAGVALVRGGVTVMAIVDLVHLAPETALGACLLAGERFCLVTDAIEATGLGPGRYRLGDRTVLVDNGQARLA